MANFYTLSKQNFKERYLEHNNSPIEEFYNVILYEDFKVQGTDSSIFFKNMLKNEDKRQPPIIKSKINHYREVLSYLDLDREGMYKGSLSDGYYSFEDKYNDFINKDLDFISNYNKADLVSFFIENFGFDFQSQHFFSDCEGFENYEEKRKVTYGHLINHMCGIKTLRLKPYIHSKIIRVEINPNRAFNKSVDLSLSEMIGWFSGYINADPYFVERSKNYKGSAILYFELSDYMSDNKKAELEDYFLSKFKIQVHIQRKDEYALLPFSSEFIYRGKFSLTETLKVEFQILEDIFKNIKNRKSQSVYGISKLINGFYDGEIVQKDSERIKGNMSSNMEMIALSKFSYGRGTRHYYQPKLAMWCASQSLSCEQFIDLAYICNVSDSRDMRKWSSSKIKSYLTRMFEYAENRVDPDRMVQQKQSNVQGKYQIKDNSLPIWLNEHKDYENELRNFLNIMYSKNKNGKQSGKWKEYFINDTINLYKFLLRKKQYDTLTQIDYEKGFKDLEKGVLLPTKMFKDLSVHLKMKTNIKKIIKFLNETNLISKVEIDGYSYSYKKKIFACHYLMIDNFIEMKKIIDKCVSLCGYVITSKKARFCRNSYNNNNKKINSKNYNSLFFRSINYVVNFAEKTIQEKDHKRERKKIYLRNYVILT